MYHHTGYETPHTPWSFFALIFLCTVTVLTISPLDCQATRLSALSRGLVHGKILKDGPLEPKYRNPSEGGDRTAIRQPPQLVTSTLGSVARIKCGGQRRETVKVLYATFPNTVPEALDTLVLRTIGRWCDGQAECNFPVDVNTFPFISTMVNNATYSPVLRLSYVCLASPGKATTASSTMRPNGMSTSAAMPLKGGGWAIKIPISPMAKQYASSKMSRSAWDFRGSSAQDILSNRRKALEKEFLVMPGIIAQCKNQLPNSVYKTIDKAKLECLKSPYCTYFSILHAPGQTATILTLCSDSHFNTPKRSFGATSFIKGMSVIEGLSKDSPYVVYLNQQAVCESADVVDEEDNVVSLEQAVTRCSQVLHCDYFVMTTESGLDGPSRLAAGDDDDNDSTEEDYNILQSVSNHLWMCRRAVSGSSPQLAGQTHQREGNTFDKELGTILGSSAMAIPLEGVVSGYSVSMVQDRGAPLLIASPNAGGHQWLDPDW